MTQATDQATNQATDLSTRARELCQLAPVVPVIVIEDANDAIPLAEALVAGGLPVLEVTLRTPAALDAIRAMTRVKGGHVGAGSISNAQSFHAARDAGATFGVSPGTYLPILDLAVTHDMPFLSGVATASEAMTLANHGFTVQKFFPAEINGGAKALGAIGAPLPDIQFCPTGGVSLANALDYLRLKNVICVGGSWVVPKDVIAAKDWAQIETLAREAAALSR